MDCCNASETSAQTINITRSNTEDQANRRRKVIVGCRTVKSLSTMATTMGCTGSSTGNQGQGASAAESDTLDSFLRLDRDIWREEKSAPAPTLGHCVAQLEQLDSQISNTGDHPLSPSYRHYDAEEAIQKAVVELQINQNPKNAIEHEEFIANLTRQALRQSRLRWLEQRRRDTQLEADQLTERVHHLQTLYEQMDALFSKIGGWRLSELEVQLDRVRSYRDTLYSAELSWRQATRLAQAAGALARAAHHSWASLDTTTNVVTRFRVANDCRNAIHEAALCIQSAQACLSGVMFPYCTLREISALLQVIDYTYTDLQIPDRYSHALEVYNSFQRRAALLCNWLRQMMENTIRKDVQDVDERIVELAAKLSNERCNFIRQKIGLRSSRQPESRGEMRLLGPTTESRGKLKHYQSNGPHTLMWQ